MTNVAIFGSTGSIGQNALDILRKNKRAFNITALTTNSNIGLLKKQIEEFRPRYVCVNDRLKAGELKSALKGKTKIFAGEEGLLEISSIKEIDRLLMAITGSAALNPLIEAVKSEKIIALANKEAIVMAGEIIRERAAINKVKIIPVDSEQSAIWQCIEGRDKNDLKKIYLTGSGGPFRKVARRKLNKVGIRDVLKHPRWKMGQKISVDSATMMNKGLEFIETMFLFGAKPDKIEILIHPEAIIHSMVEFRDSVILAQLSVTDMRIPIQYALSYPLRFTSHIESVDFARIGSLCFEEPDFEKFPCLRLAHLAAQELGTMPAVLNASDEVAIASFLSGRIKFVDIPVIVEKVLFSHRKVKNPSLTDILEADKWARGKAIETVDKLK
jgi:1-deoxy-D-xylulose-5-phosphate reductoisomerase